MAFAVGALLSVAIFGGLAMVLLRAIHAVVVPSPKYPLLPSVLALIVAWLLSWPVAGVIVDTLLGALDWGHAGAAFVFPFLALSPFVSIALLSSERRRFGSRSIGTVEGKK